jgi:hypothetical protein
MAMNIHICCQSHCCIKHGCKYGYDDCPVETGKVKQDGPCEECGLGKEGYYGERIPIDYDMYVSYGVKRAATPQERLLALSNAYFGIVAGHKHPVDEEVYEAINKLKEKYSNE